MLKSKIGLYFQGRGSRDIHRNVASSVAKSRRPVEFSESEREESEYETEGEEDDGSPPRRSYQEAEQDYGEEDVEHEQGEEETYAESEEEAEVRDSF